MPLLPEQLDTLRTLLPPEDIIQQDDSDVFTANSLPWSLANDQRPSLIVTPSTVGLLASVFAWLCRSDLDFAVRGSGCGSVSSKDVIISMKNFVEVTFDEHAEEAVIGAGLDWGEVDERLAHIAPDYVIVGARCPFVGVAGSTLLGGLSWLSHSLGLGSDPANLVDVHIVLPTGEALWASESPDPDLLWALRGAGGNFGVVTRLRFKAHRYKRNIWAGMITYPATSLAAVSKAVSRFAAIDDPDLALHVFIVDFSMRALHGGAAEPSLVLLPFDAHGQAHAESSAGFQWALNIPGAQVECAEMPLRGVHELQRASQASHGQTDSWLQAALVTHIDEGFVERAWAWYENIVTSPATQKFGLGTFALLEIMQDAALTQSGSDSATAWPHFSKGRKHVLQLSTGCTPAPSAKRAENEEAALAIMRTAPATISGTEMHPPSDFLPNFLLPNHDPAVIFGANWERIRRTKGRYDPQGKIYGGVHIPPLVHS